MLDADEISDKLVEDEYAEEICYKVKEDSLMQDRSMGTNQSERSGSTFSLPGNWNQADAHLNGHSRKCDNLRLPPFQSPKSQSAAQINLRGLHGRLDCCEELSA